RDFALSAAATTAAEATVASPQRRVVVLARQLTRFLKDPLDGAMRRHLLIRDDWDLPPEDDEPFFSTWPADTDCKRHLVRQFVLRAATGQAAEAIGGMSRDLEMYADVARKIGRMPDGSFGAVDRADLLGDVQRTIG